MRKYKMHFILLFGSLLFNFNVFANYKTIEPDKQTHIYAIKDTNVLKMDVYRLPHMQENQPCVVFLFGGGFRRGERDNKGFLPYFNFLANSGYTVISIDYRLGLKDQKRSLQGIQKAVDMAVDDLIDATSYILKNSEKWRINPDLIVVNGSSAGGITVLNSMYMLSHGNTDARLPKGFQFAGVIAFSGAIFNVNGDINFSKPVCPVMLFHGDADPTVPYNHITRGPIGFYGSSYIAKKLEAAGSPYWFFSFVNEGHNVSGWPRSVYKDEILKFLDNMVVKKQPWIIKTEVKTIGKERDPGADSLDGFLGFMK